MGRNIFNVHSLREYMVDHLERNRSEDPDTVHEYIEEAEWQDGEAYWLQFSSPKDMLTDYDLYVEEVTKEYSVYADPDDEE